MNSKANNFQVLYYVAVDFIDLTYVQKINLGLDLNLITTAHLFSDEKELETVIFKKMYPEKLEKFIQKLYRIKHEFKQG